MLGFAGMDAIWYVVAAFGAALMFGLITGFRRLGRWFGGRVKQAYLDWFAEAVDTHVEPKLELVRENSNVAAEGIKNEAVAVAAAVRVETLATATALRQELVAHRAELVAHTEEEGALVRGIVQEEIAPVMQILNDRTSMFAHLEASLTETNDTLAQTQLQLREHMDRDEVFAQRVGADLRAGQAALLRTITRNQDVVLEDHANKQAELLEEKNRDAGSD